MVVVGGSVVVVVVGAVVVVVVRVVDDVDEVDEVVADDGRASPLLGSDAHAETADNPTNKTAVRIAPRAFIDLGRDDPYPLLK